MNKITIALLCLAASPAFAGDVSSKGTKDLVIASPAAKTHEQGWYGSVDIDQSIGAYDQSSFTKIGGDEKGYQANLMALPKPSANFSLGYEKKYYYTEKPNVFWRLQGTVNKKETAFNESSSYVVGGVTTVNETVDVKYKQDAKISMHIGMEPKVLKGFGVYGILGVGSSSKTVSINNDQGLSVSETKKVVIPEVGFGIQKELKKGSAIYAEYSMSELPKQVDKRHNTVNGYTEHKADVGFDSLRFGLRFKF